VAYTGLLVVVEVVSTKVLEELVTQDLVVVVAALMLAQEMVQDFPQIMPLEQTLNLILVLVEEEVLVQ